MTKYLSFCPPSFPPTAKSQLMLAPSTFLAGDASFFVFGHETSRLLVFGGWGQFSLPYSARQNAS